MDDAPDLAEAQRRLGRSEFNLAALYYARILEQARTNRDPDLTRQAMSGLEKALSGLASTEESRLNNIPAQMYGILARYFSEESERVTTKP